MAASKQTETPTFRPSRVATQRVRRLIRDHGLLRPGDSVLVGVSGGPDSTCLLLTLAALRRSLRFHLSVAYFDHGLRGPRASRREERFVRALAEALEAPFESGAGDVREYAAGNHRSIEDAARELRYRFLAEAAAEAGCTIVAVGHTRDDQAETVLLHLIRGSGLRGLAAMSPSASWPVPSASGTPTLIRPLLEISRDETEACCRTAGVAPLEDPTNRSQAHLRNRIRAELLPLLRSYNPRIEDALARFAGAASGDIDLLEQLADEALIADTSAAGAVSIDRAVLASMPAALQGHALRIAIGRLLGDQRGLSERHVRSLLAASRGSKSAHLDLTRGVQAEVTRDKITLSLTRPPAPATLPESEVALTVPGKAQFGHWRFEAAVVPRPAGGLTAPDPCAAYLSVAALGENLTLRRRRRGDRFQPLGMAGSKKLQDFFVDGRVPREERDGVPLLCTERGIAWVVGLRPAEWAKVPDSAKRVLRVRGQRNIP
ncbi:MAG: tRNA lysidine(34) synthetase TilS [Chloroflexi bacterium]|nr:tRNA lysidine(34) synthetase TilS [Chloroflexota bacterium]